MFSDYDKIYVFAPVYFLLLNYNLQAKDTTDQKFFIRSDSFFINSSITECTNNPQACSIRLY